MNTAPTAPLSPAGLAELRSYGYDSEAALDAAVAAAAAEKASDARFDALVRHDLAATFTTLRWRCAATLCATATPSAWFDLSLDVAVISVGERNRARRDAVEQAAGAMACSRPDLAAQHLADLCGLSVETWAAQVAAEMAVSL